MKEVLDFLTESKVFFVATADNNIPHVRPFGFVMDCGGKLAFCTSNQMDVCKQLAENPNESAARPFLPHQRKHSEKL